MSKFPLDPCLSRCVLQAVEEKCVKEVLTISAMLSAESVWYTRRWGPHPVVALC
jgi:HrpA-like RNA helicase